MRHSRLTLLGLHSIGNRLEIVSGHGTVKWRVRRSWRRRIRSLMWTSLRVAAR